MSEFEYIEATPEKLNDGWVMIADASKQDILNLWTGDGWTEDFAEGWKAASEEVLMNELIKMSSLDIDGQPILVETAVVQETEGEYAGKWYIEVTNVSTMMRGEEILRGDTP